MATEYDDWTGRRVHGAGGHAGRMYHPLRVPAQTEAQRAEALTAHERLHWARSPCPPRSSPAPGPHPVRVTHGDPVGLWLRLEDGGWAPACGSSRTTVPLTISTVHLIGEATFELPADLPVGYHRLHLQVGSFDAATAGDRVSGAR